MNERANLKFDEINQSLIWYFWKIRTPTTFFHGLSISQSGVTYEIIDYFQKNLSCSRHFQKELSSIILNFPPTLDDLMIDHWWFDDYLQTRQGCFCLRFVRHFKPIHLQILYYRVRKNLLRNRAFSNSFIWWNLISVILKISLDMYSHQHDWIQCFSCKAYAMHTYFRQDGITETRKSSNNNKILTAS